MEENNIFADWIISGLMDKENPFSSLRIFSSQEEAFYFFDISDSDSLLYRFTPELTKKQTKATEKMFNTLDIDFTKLSMAALLFLDGKKIDARMADVLAICIGKSGLLISDLINILKNTSFKYKAELFQRFYERQLDNDDEAITEYFKINIFNFIDKHLIHEMMENLSNEIICTRFEYIMKRLLPEGEYQFNEKHIQIMLQNDICLDSMINNYSDKTTDEDEILKFTNGILLAHENGKIDAFDIKSLLVGPRGTYAKLLRQYPQVVSSRQVDAALSLEYIKTKKVNFSITGYMLDKIQKKKAMQPKPINEFKDIYPSHLWIPILNHISAFIMTSEKTSNDLALEISQEINKESDNAIATEIIDAIKYLNGEIKLSEVKCKNFGLALISNHINFPSFPIFQYGSAISDKWYDNYTKKLYDEINIASPSYLQDLNSKELIDYKTILNKANKAGSHYFLVSQAPIIKSISSSWFELPGIEEVFLSSLRLIDRNTLKDMPYSTLLNCLFIALKHDMKIALDILSFFPVKTIFGQSTKNLFEKENINTEIISNMELIHKVLSLDLSDLDTDVLQLQTGVIGRVKKDVDEADGIIVILIMMAIKVGLIKKSSKSYDIPEKTCYTDRLSYRVSAERRFEHKHFPRLRNADALEKIELISRYFSSIGILENISGGDYSTEGLYKNGDTIYVFGEFNWNDLIKECNSSIHHIVFNYISYNEDIRKINEVKLTINESTTAILSLLQEAFGDSEVIIHNSLYRASNESPLENCKNYYLPKVEFQGVNLNK